MLLSTTDLRRINNNNDINDVNNNDINDTNNNDINVNNNDVNDNDDNDYYDYDGYDNCNYNNYNNCCTTPSDDEQPPQTSTAARHATPRATAASLDRRRFRPERPLRASTDRQRDATTPRNQITNY